VSRRREDDIAIVTAGIRVLLTADNQVVEFGASYGGMAASTVDRGSERKRERGREGEGGE
jgi:xanthine dehydrogenase iron-sulfur cluster and FAD-binding subunit A